MISRLQIAAPAFLLLFQQMHRSAMMNEFD
jgi:hypothetical protein